MSALIPWRDRCTTVTEAFTYMLEKEILVDVIFKKNEGCKLFAHKLVLSLWSPVFATMVAQTGEREVLTIQVSEDMDVLESLIKYLYSSETDCLNKCFAKMPIEKLAQAIEFSRRYEMVHIYEKCMLSLNRRKINPGNVIEFFDYGLKENVTAIVDKCIHVLRHKGIKSKFLKEDVSFATIMGLLDLDRIALDSEADLLSLAISWLSYPSNKQYKSILSFIDLLSIDWTEYKDVIKKFPNFFTDSELSSVLLGVVHQDSKRFPDWFNPKVSSVSKRSCSTCVSVCRNLNVSTDLSYLKGIRLKDSTDFCLTFEFGFDFFVKARLLKAELNFGPKEIPKKAFKLMFNKRRTGPWKECSIISTYGCQNYSVHFGEPVELISGDHFTLKFNFQAPFRNKIQVILPNLIQNLKLGKALSKGCVRIKLLYKMAFYTKIKNPKFLVSSFSFNFCEHNTYLIRKYVKSDDWENSMDVDKEEENLTGPNTAMKTDIKLEANHNFCNTKDIKMEIFPNDDYSGECFVMNVISPDNIKKEIIDIADSSPDT